MLHLYKLEENDEIELYGFLKKLKRANWMIDLIDEIETAFIIIDWHIKLTKNTECYDKYEFKEQLSRMTADLARYFKENKPDVKKKYCYRCRKTKTIDYFLSGKICKICQKKLEQKKPLK